MSTSGGYTSSSRVIRLKSDASSSGNKKSFPVWTVELSGYVEISLSGGNVIFLEDVSRERAPTGSFRFLFLYETSIEISPR